MRPRFRKPLRGEGASVKWRKPRKAFSLCPCGIAPIPESLKPLLYPLSYGGGRRRSVTALGAIYSRATQGRNLSARRCLDLGRRVELPVNLVHEVRGRDHPQVERAQRLRLEDDRVPAGRLRVVEAHAQAASASDARPAE